jgi:hypothetical protein
MNRELVVTFRSDTARKQTYKAESYQIKEGQLDIYQRYETEEYLQLAASYAPGVWIEVRFHE